MKTKIFVSNVVSFDEISKDKFNLIKAPTGCGKTTFCLNELPKLAKERSRVLYLCPTRELLSQLIEQNPEVRGYDPTIDDIAKWDFVDFFEGGRDGISRPEDDRILAMTYEKFGMLTMRTREIKPIPQGGDLAPFIPDTYDFVDYYDVVIADEFHDYDWRIANEAGVIRKQILKVKPWLANKAHKAELEKEVSFRQYNESIRLAAFDAITSSCGSKYVVGISATPECNYLKTLETKNLVNRIKSCAQLKAMEIKNTIRTNNLKQTIASIPNDKLVLFYTPRITEMLGYETWAKKCGFNTCSLWSSNNVDHPMTEEQLKIRDWIRKEGTYPDGVNFLLINKAYEMGISMKSTVDVIVINSEDENVQTQVQGRTRQDELDTLYVYDKTAETNEFILPNKFIGTPLSKEEKNELCEFMNLRDKKGVLLKWTSVKRELIAKGFVIKQKRIGSKNYDVISA